MTMNLNRFARLGEDFAAERGPLRLYALLEREDDLDRWDMILAASWIKGITIEDMEYVIGRMGKLLSRQERDMVRHIILLRQDEPTVKSILDVSQPAAEASSGAGREIHRRYVNGMLINQGYVFAADTNSKAAARRTLRST